MGRDGDMAYVVPEEFIIDRFSFRDIGNLKEDIMECHHNSVLYHWMERLFSEAQKENPRAGAGHDFYDGRYIQLREEDLNRLEQDIRSGKILKDYSKEMCQGPDKNFFLEYYHEYPKVYQENDLQFVRTAKLYIRAGHMAVYYISWP